METHSLHCVKGVQISDPENVFSKAMKKRIKSWYKENINGDDIVQRSGGHYDSVVVDDSQHDLVVLSFTKQKERDVQKKLLSQRLRGKLRTLRNSRTNSYVSDAWREYEKIIALPNLRNMTDDQRRVVIPDPDMITKNSDVYRTLLQTLPISPIKDYFELCLQDTSTSSGIV